jgi:hypothetical protein
MDDQFDWNKNFEEWSKGKKEPTEIVKIMQSIHLLMDGCTANLTHSQLKVIKKRMDTTIKQCVFWKKQDNTKRFIYDLREFGIWLADFISEAENKFWENENNS